MLQLTVEYVLSNPVRSNFPLPASTASGNFQEQELLADR
jgi:hypothetical protein